MSDEPVPTGEKEYWHDKRLESSRAAASSGLPGPVGQSAVSPVVTPPPVRTYRNLRHPIASFVLVVLAVILAGVGLLAVTGNGALPGPPLKLAACAPPHSALLGAPGAQFTADFPVGPRPPPWVQQSMTGASTGSLRMTEITPARWVSVSRRLMDRCMRTAGQWVALARCLIG